MEKVPSPCERLPGGPGQPARWTGPGGEGHGAGKAAKQERPGLPPLRPPERRALQLCFLGFVRITPQGGTTHGDSDLCQDGAPCGCGLFYQGSGDFQGPVLQSQPRPQH